MALLDRLLRPVNPVADASVRPPPRPLADGLWTIDRRLRMPGGIGLPTRSLAVRLRSGDLLLHSPPPLDPELRDALDALGPVRHLVAPNSFHHLYAGECRAAFPEATLWLAPGLRERFPGLSPARVLDGAETPPWAEELEPLVYGPAGGLSEVAFFHHPSRTLLLTDLCFNPQTASNRREEWFWRLDGVWRRFGLGRTVKLTLLRDPRPLRAFVERALRWDFERVTVAHGDVLTDGARDAFRRAFASWLG